LSDAIKRAEKAGYDLIFIDTPGRDEPATAAADLCIIPCRPTPGDTKANARTRNPRTVEVDQ
jgi:chromosome partitioning protein